MNFYHTYYKRQFYDEYLNEWVDTDYVHQGIIVIANNYDEAKTKIEKCLTKVEREGYRVVLTSDIDECIGLDRRHEFEDSFYMNPIFDK